MNFAFHPAFPGVSLNVPERIALFDIWNEIDNLIQNGPLPVESIPLLAERARAIARSIPELESIEALTLESFSPRFATLLIQFSPDSREFVERRTKLEELRYLLTRLARPIGGSELPAADLNSAGNSVPLDPRGFSDEALKKYLTKVVVLALRSYKVQVESNFASLSSVLNTYAQLPCSVLIVSDRISVRLALFPEQTDEIGISAVVVQSAKINVGDPAAEISVEGTPLKVRVREGLTAMHKLRPPIQPVDSIIPIEEFFSLTPVNDLVKKWLTADIGAVFGY